MWTDVNSICINIFLVFRLEHGSGQVDHHWILANKLSPEDQIIGGTVLSSNPAIDRNPSESSICPAQNQADYWGSQKVGLHLQKESFRWWKCSWLLCALVHCLEKLLSTGVRALQESYPLEAQYHWQNRIVNHTGNELFSFLKQIPWYSYRPVALWVPGTAKVFGFKMSSWPEEKVLF